MSEVYLGNPNLKKANTQIEFTQENIIEFLKCKDDPVYFANNYIKIVSLDEGLFDRIKSKEDVEFEKSEFKRETRIPLVKKKTNKNIKTA